MFRIFIRGYLLDQHFWDQEGGSWVGQREKSSRMAGQTTLAYTTGSSGAEVAREGCPATGQAFIQYLPLEPLLPAGCPLKCWWLKAAYWATLLAAGATDPWRETWAAPLCAHHSMSQVQRERIRMSGGRKSLMMMFKSKRPIKWFSTIPCSLKNREESPRRGDMFMPSFHVFQKAISKSVCILGDSYAIL